jgi:THO complex subunit 2
VHAIEHDPLIGTYQDTAANISKRNTDRQDYLDKIRKLELERKQHFEHVRVVMSRLQREKNHWFPGDGSNRLDIVRCILQYCIHPRSLFSGTDSLFSAKFVLLLHSLNAKNFSTLSFVERVSSEMTIVQLIIRLKLISSLFVM